MTFRKSNKMNLIFIALFFIVSLNASINSQISHIGNDKPLQQETAKSINSLRHLLMHSDNLNPSYGSKLYSQVKDVADLLYKLKQTIPYNNVVHGNNNKVSGKNIVVIGSKDTVQGRNDWIFSSDYHSSTPESGILLIDNWKIDLEKVGYLLAYPPLCITTIKGVDFKNMFTNMMNTSDENGRMMF